MSRPAPGAGPPPVSFKTVPGRHRTQKWNTAKTYNYDGDEWGGYDPYDEYGGYDEPPPPPMPSQSPYSSQQRLAKQSSFDEGDERRAFSGPGSFPASRGAASPARSAVSTASGGRRPSNDTRRPSNDHRPSSRPRDFTNPDAAPPPLNTRSSPAPTPPMLSSATFTPRKTSMGSGSPAPEAVPTAAKQDKELPQPPFIRPSDIYRRVEEEKEKERTSSMDSSSRPSLDDPSTRSNSHPRPLSKVDETPASDMAVGGMPEEFGEPRQKSLATSPVLPPVHSFSGFGSDFFGGGSSSQAELSTSTATRAPPGSDPAADIQTERANEVPIADVGRQPDSLSHQPSQGYRSVVNKAFDRPDDSSTIDTSVSRDNSRSTDTVGVSRSDTNSTSSISPIMSSMPTTAAAGIGQAVPTIAEEPRNRMSSDSNQFPRKPSPAGSDLPTAAVQPGYRRSLDPPSSDNSPARTPGLESTENKRLSQPLAAETVIETAGPGIDIPVRAGRARAGTDYSIRESDIAHEINASPEKAEFDADAAEKERANRELFLREHSNTQTSSPVLASGRNSPSKGRVRQIADQYQEIEESSRRNSQVSTKSSWSNFRGSDENLPGRIPKRQETGQSNVTSESDGGEGGGIGESPALEDESSKSPLQQAEQRPPMASQQSFRPQLPGEWVSESGATPRETPTPGVMGASQHTPSDSRESTDEPVDLTPTTRKVSLPGDFHNEPSLLGQAKNAGDALGAALMAKVGVGSNTRDFASAEPAREVEVPSERNATGELGYLQAPERPELTRGDTGQSMASTLSAASASSSVPPTPPAKDTPQPLTRDIGDDGQSYFAPAAVAPLRTGKSQESTPDSPSTFALQNYDASSPSGGLQRDDTLRREIVRSLETARGEDAARTEDALDAPENQQRVSEGEKALPAREISDTASAQPRPTRMLDQRFSWEVPLDEDTTTPKETPVTTPGVGGVPRVQEPPQPEVEPEIRPEMPYERPRSRGLRLMNADDDSEDDERKEAVRDSVTAERGMETGLPIGAAGLLAAAQPNRLGTAGTSSATRSQDGDPSWLGGLTAPSPVLDGDGGSLRLPSYSKQDAQSSGPDDKPLAVVAPQPVADDDEPTTRDTGPAPATPAKPTTTSPTSPTTFAKHQQQKIPPFREILAIKSPDARIHAYDDTRRTFAATDTGLADWLTAMLDANPEYAHLPSAVPTLPRTATGSHKPSPSLGGKFTRQFSTGGGPGEADGANVDMDKVKERGKDLMKGAGVLGGKAQAGAKGLFAKGKSRFGTQRESKGGAGGSGGKAPSPSSTAQQHPSTPAAPFDISSLPGSGALPASARRRQEVFVGFAAVEYDKALPEHPRSRGVRENGSSADAPAADSAPAVHPGALISGSATHERDNIIHKTPSAEIAPFADDLPTTSSSNPPPSAPPELGPMLTDSILPSYPPISSPTRPPISRTPSSSSGALGRTFSRLRQSFSERSRSRGSRPPSLVLTSSSRNTVSGNDEERGRAGAKWPDPDSLAAAETLRRDASVVPERLGILPSPTATFFSDTPPKTPGRFEGVDAVVAAKDEEEEGGLLRDAATPRLGRLATENVASPTPGISYLGGVPVADEVVGDAASSASARDRFEPTSLGSEQPVDQEQSRRSSYALPGQQDPPTHQTLDDPSQTSASMSGSEVPSSFDVDAPFQHPPVTRQTQQGIQPRRFSFSGLVRNRRQSSSVVPKATAAEKPQSAHGDVQQRPPHRRRSSLFDYLKRSPPSQQRLQTEGRKKRFSGMGSLFSRSASYVGEQTPRKASGEAAASEQPELPLGQEYPSPPEVRDQGVGRRSQSFDHHQQQQPPPRQSFDHEPITLPPPPPPPPPHQYQHLHEPMNANWTEPFQQDRTIAYPIPPPPPPPEDTYTDTHDYYQPRPHSAHAPKPAWLRAQWPAAGALPAIMPPQYSRTDSEDYFARRARRIQSISDNLRGQQQEEEEEERAMDLSSRGMYGERPYTSSGRPRRPSGPSPLLPPRQGRYDRGEASYDTRRRGPMAEEGFFSTRGAAERRWGNYR